MKQPLRRYTPWLILLWAILIISTFWLYQFRWISGYPEQQWVSFLDTAVNNPWPDPQRITVAHIIDPACPCSRFAYAHIDTLEQAFGREVQFIRVDLQSTHQKTQALLQNIPATPAVVIWNRDGKLAYVGPYSSGAFCGEGRDLTRLILTQLKQGINPEWTRQEAVGCFCPLTAATSALPRDDFRKLE